MCCPWYQSFLSSSLVPPTPHFSFILCRCSSVTGVRDPPLISVLVSSMSCTSCRACVNVFVYFPRPQQGRVRRQQKTKTTAMIRNNPKPTEPPASSHSPGTWHCFHLQEVQFLVLPPNKSPSTQISSLPHHTHLEELMQLSHNRFEEQNPELGPDPEPEPEPEPEPDPKPELDPMLDTDSVELESDTNSVPPEDLDPDPDPDPDPSS